MSEQNCDKDLPLMANTKDVLVHHYMLNLSCCFSKKTFSGNVILHIEPSGISICIKCNKSLNDKDESIGFTLQKSELHRDFECILDCCDIIVTDVEELDIIPGKFEQNKFVFNKESFSTNSKLSFCVEKWSLKIWKPGVCCPCAFPPFIRITYCTKPEGQSLMWVKDQDGRPAVFTYGAWVNNRSLFPCQEPPVAMASWEATISTAFPAVVLMSGDNKPAHYHHNGIVTYYYNTKMKLPLSTLALAVGYWDVECHFECKPKDFQTDVRLCASSSLLPSFVEEFSTYVFCCIKAAEELFGPYPFPRIDFLVVPRGFCSLGMASPNIIFISQSLLSGDKSMLSRVAHEIAHAWFGLLIGALDWREEWLSEGFATFAEDIIHAKTLGLSEKEMEELFQIKSYMRSRTLLAEVDNTTEEDLLVLRPNNGVPVVQRIENVDAVVLKNGRNEEKCFMQVHYIKGFFLLRFLSNIVGLPSFLQFLRTYIEKFQGRLVNSLEMLEFFVCTFPQVQEKAVTVDSIVSEWLSSPQIPEAIISCALPASSQVFSIAQKEAIKWKKLNQRCSGTKYPKKRKYSVEKCMQISVDALSMLLDFLLDEDKLHSHVLKMLNNVYTFERKNAEIRHKWCELVAKHRYHAGYACVENFLKEDLAMGVYLYGELILNGTKSQKQLAEDCFKNVKSEMEPNCITTIQHMLELYEKG